MKIKTKRNLKKLMSSITIVFVLVTLAEIILGFGNKAYALGFGVDSLIGNGTFAALSIAMAGIPFIIVSALKLVIMLVGFVLQILMSGAFSSLESNFEWASLGDIIFAGSENASQFLDVNFFNLNVTNNVALLTFRTAVAKWYYILRLISTAILLVILIYVGIRMALSTIASEQAKYKQMLTDWVTSLALLFLLHYIIMFIITVNSSLVSALKEVTNDCTDDMMVSLVGTMFLPGIEGIFAAIVYTMYVGQIFAFFLLYAKRMITVGFLIMIAPLITITYAIDKIGDGKAQALNAWLKELVYNILIQPFHCIVFMSFFDAIASIINEQTLSIGAYIFAIVIMQFMKKAEDILKKIFHFEAGSMSSLKETGQSIANTTGTFAKVGMKAGSVVSNFHAAGGIKAAKANWQQFKLDVKNNRGLHKAFKEQKKDGIKSYKQYKQSEEGQEAFENINKTNAAQMKAKADAKRAKKIDRNKRSYERKNGAGSYQQMIDNKTEKAKNKYIKEHGVDGYKAMLDEKAKQIYDKKHGEGTYERMQHQASKTGKDGKLTANAKKAQQRINAARKEAADGMSHDEFIKEGGAGIKRTLKDGWANTGGRVYNNMRQLADTEYGKVALATMKDSTRVAAAIGMGAFGLGAGDFKDAISLGQIGYGFTTGLLKQSTGTLAKDSLEKAQQIAALNGKDASDPTVIQSILNQIKSDRKAGLLDPKAITAELERLEKAVTSLYSDRKKGNLDFSQFRLDLQSTAIDGKLNPAEIHRLVEQNFGSFDKDEKDEIEIKATNYINIISRAGIATNQNTIEDTGLDADELNAKILNRIDKVKFST